MISNRCTTYNLLNHLQQTNKIKNYEVNYIYEKQHYGKEWLCLVSFEDGDTKYSYTENTARKRNSLYSILKTINPILSDIAGMN